MKKLGTYTKALLVVDVQNDFCPGGSLAVSKGDEVVKPLNKIMAYAKKNGWLVAASRDWHPKITKHFAKYGGLWPVHCVQNTRGANFHPKLERRYLDKLCIISKGFRPDEDAYSAFDGENPLGVTLEKFLKNNGIKELCVGGLATDYCVKASALDAAKKGFKVYLLLDACRAVNLKKGDEEKAIREMKKAGVIITTTKEVMNGVRN